MMEMHGSNYSEMPVLVHQELDTYYGWYKPQVKRLREERPILSDFILKARETWKSDRYKERYIIT